MKDIVITSQRITKEIRIFIIAFIISNLLNIYSIIAYGTSWGELVSSLVIIVLLTVVMYVAMLVSRLVYKAFLKIIKPVAKL